MYYKDRLNSYLDMDLLNGDIELTPAEKFLYMVLDNMRDSDGDILTTYKKLADVMNISLHKLYPMFKNVTNVMCLSIEKMKVDNTNYLFLHFDLAYYDNGKDVNKVFIKKLNDRLQK